MENLFRQQALERKRRRLQGNISLVHPPLFKFLALLLFIIVTVSLVFLASGSYTRKERVTGVLQPNKGLIRLGAPNAGIVSEVLVTEGEKVKKGQTLLRITSEKYGVDGVELNQSIIRQYKLQITSLQFQIQQQEVKNRLEIEELEYNKSSFEKSRKQLENRKSIYSERMELNKEIYEQITAMATKNYVSKLELSKHRDTFLSLKQELLTIEEEKLALESQLTKTKNRLNQLPIEHSKALIALKTELEDLKVQVISQKQQRLGELRASVDGVVSTLLTKPGKSTLPNQNLVAIVPFESTMQAIAYVPTSAFGFVEKGQSTRIRYHAFPYEKYGTYAGVISETSESVILPSEASIPGIISEPSYRITIDLNSEHVSAYGRKIPLRSGMRLDADIIMEERTLLQWLFDPIISVKGKL